MKALQDADLALGVIPPGDSYTLYSSLHQTCKRLAPLTDAFYIALYDRENELLLFPYNFDGDSYDPPLTTPLGKGPTSWVVEHDTPYVFNGGDPLQHEGLAFGDVSRKSRSAVHLPVRATRSGGDEALIGVLSAQSYSPEAFSEDAQVALALLARRTGAILIRYQLELDAKAREEAAASAMARQRNEHTQQIRAMAGRFVDILQELTTQAEKLRDSSVSGDGMSAATLRQLCALCYRGQTEAANLPLPALPAQPGDDRPEPNNETPFASLSEREREILLYVAAGESNAEIARRLSVSVDTVKFHCKGLFRKLGVSNRVQAAQMHHAWQAKHPELLLRVVKISTEQ